MWFRTAERCLLLDRFHLRFNHPDIGIGRQLDLVFPRGDDNSVGSLCRRHDRREVLTTVIVMIREPRAPNDDRPRRLESRHKALRASEPGTAGCAENR